MTATIKSFLVFLSIISVFLFGFLVYRNYSHNITESKRIKDKEAFAIFGIDPTSKSQKEYLEKLNTELQEKNITPERRDDLLLKKAVTIGIVRTKNPDLTEAITTYTKLIASGTSTQESVINRDKSLISLVQLRQRCCFDPTLTPGSIEESYYKAHKKEGYTDAVAKLLTLDDLLGLISTGNKDQYALAHSMNIKAILLDAYSLELPQTKRAQILNSLGKDLQLYNTTKATSLYAVNIDHANIVSGIQLAYANDVYLTNLTGKTKNKEQSDTTNKAIDTRYEAAETMAENNKMVRPIDLNWFLMHAYLHHLNSLSKRYPQVKITATENILIEKALKSMSFSQDNKNIAYNNFSLAIEGQKTNDTSRERFTHFMSLAKTHKNIADFLTSIGITQ